MSLHNIATTIGWSEVSTLLHSIHVVSYKRGLNSDTKKPSDLAFLLLETAEDAVKVFLLLDGAKMGGEDARVNIVHGIHFGEEHMIKKKMKENDQNSGGVKHGAPGPIAEAQHIAPVNLTKTQVLMQRQHEGLVKIAAANSQASIPKNLEGRDYRRIPGEFPLEDDE